MLSKCRHDNLRPVVRSFSPEDLSSCVALINEADRVDRLGKATSPGRLRELLGHPHCDPERDLFLAEGAGRLVGYLEVTRELEIGRVIFGGAVHPEFRRCGIGTLLLEEGLLYSRRLGAQRAHLPVREGRAASQRFAESQGFVVVRHHWYLGLRVNARLETPQPPQGYALRYFRRGDEGRLTEIQNLTFGDTWGFRPNLVQEIRYLVETSFGQPAGIIFATLGEEVVGYCWARGQGEKGQVWMIGVAPRHRGRGLGKALLLEGCHYLKGCGVKEVELTVDRENGSALRLYELVGFGRRGVTLWYEKALFPQAP